MLLAAAPVLSAERIVSSRVWPAQEYTRVTLESPRPMKHQFFFVADPHRLVVDLENVELGPELKALPSRVGDKDPYIQAVRVAVNRPGVVRVVFDLRTEVKPSLFPLVPAGEYKHRLVIDLYPAKPVDPLLALLQPRPDAIAEIGEAPMSARAPLPAEAVVAAAPDATATATIPVAPSVTPPVATRPAATASAPVIAASPNTPRPAAAQVTVVVPPRLPVVKLDAAQVARTEITAPKPDSDPLPLVEASKRTPAGKQPKVDRLVIVAIDAGHGGEDPGARGAHGTREKDVTLAIARRLKASIDKEPNMRAVLVRDGDYYVPLGDRVAKSRRMRADLFVSIHADAWVRPDAKGSSVFALSERGATSAAARMLAQRENASDLIGGVNFGVRDPVLARTLLDLSLTATINDSLKLGRHVLSELGDVNSLHKASVEQAGFAVLKAPDIPSILVETAFISNPEEEKRLKDSAYQEKIAAAVLGGIKRYLAQNPPLARSKVAAN